MKKYLIIIAALSALLFSACKNETTSGLDGSVSERIERVHQEFRTRLFEAPHGWMAYVETNQGLYRFWMEFDDVSKVNMLTDNNTVVDGDKVVEESTYSIRQYQRPTLVFDTYSYLSIINDPDNSISHGNDNQGLESDFEFEFISYGEVEYNIGDGLLKYDAITLEGRIGLSKCLLIKATQEQKDEVKSERLVAEIREVGLYGGGINNHLSASINGENVYFLLKPRTILALTEQVDGILMEQSDPMLEVKSKNLLLTNPIKAANVMIESFRWNDAEQSYYAVAGNKEFLLNKSTIAPAGLLDKIFGYKKPFTKMRMFQGFGYTFADFFLLELSGLSVTAVDLYLSQDLETKDPIMVAVIWLLDIFPLAYTFPITMNPDGSFTTSEVITFDDDISGVAEGLYDDGATDIYINRFKNMQYTIEWGDETPPKEYANETIVMFKSDTGINSKNGIMIR